MAEQAGVGGELVVPEPGSDEDAVEVVVEIPAGSRNKYEYDHERHLIRLDRRLFSATVYPADYGFVPDTLAEDGDPLDALVLVEDPTFPGCLVVVRPLGLFIMRDEHGPDAKIISVLAHDPRWDGVEDVEQLPSSVLDEIEHFFSVYKDLEPGKLTEVGGFSGRRAAWEELAKSRRRYQEAAATKAR
jgi:inorganic pyrophosphatase